MERTPTRISQEKPERMGGQRTFLLAAGAFLGVLAMGGIIHLVRRRT